MVVGALVLSGRGREGCESGSGGGRAERLLAAPQAGGCVGGAPGVSQNRSRQRAGALRAAASPPRVLNGRGAAGGSVRVRVVFGSGVACGVISAGRARPSRSKGSYGSGEVLGLVGGGVVRLRCSCIGVSGT